ncbi:ribonuclease H-like YkuK family protein [Spirochaetota bacterium]
MRKLCYDTVLTYIRGLSDKSSIYVGCDSKLSGSQTLFGLAIILHIESSKGGMCFAQKMYENRRMPISERLMKEVEHAVTCATRVQHAVGDKTLEVHLDFNPNPRHKSHKFLNAAIGYVRGQGLIYKIKPSAFAATTAADYILG